MVTKKTMILLLSLSFIHAAEDGDKEPLDTGRDGGVKKVAVPARVSQGLLRRAMLNSVIARISAEEVKGQAEITLQGVFDQGVLERANNEYLCGTLRLVSGLSLYETGVDWETTRGPIYMPNFRSYTPYWEGRQRQREQEKETVTSQPSPGKVEEEGAQKQP